MRLSRRELFRLITVTASGAALLQSTQRLAQALVTHPNPPQLLWYNEGGDDLNLLAFIGQQVPQFLSLVSLQWNLQVHDGVLPAAREPGAVTTGVAPVLVLERLPSSALLDADSDGPLVQQLRQAKAAILLGTDACYGGFTTDPDLVKRFDQACRTLKTPVIRVPGVPPPPHHLVGLLAHLDFFGFPTLDAHGRPVLYYGRTVCSACERRSDLDAGRFALAFGEDGCLLKLGCKGLVTHNSCSMQRWNDGENWCVGAGGPCVGCSEPGYPDHGGVGLYGRLIGGAEGVRPLVWDGVEAAGWGLLGLAGVGVGLQALRRWFLERGVERLKAPPPGNVDSASGRPASGGEG